jgi:hypothetical protein
MSDEELTKVHVHLPNHWATGGESFWACPLGHEVYELRLPFFLFGLAESAPPVISPSQRGTSRSQRLSRGCRS